MPVAVAGETTEASETLTPSAAVAADALRTVVEAVVPTSVVVEVVVAALLPPQPAMVAMVLT